MKSFVYHFQINISDKEKSFPFYIELLGIFDYKITYKDEDTLGLSNGTTDFWLIKTAASHVGKGFHRKNVGLNHVAFGVSSKNDVDKFVQEFLEPRGIKPLYESPREFPEYDKGYYAVYFEDPDRMKLEIVYKSGLESKI